MRPKHREVQIAGTTLTELLLSLVIFMTLVSLGTLACSERLSRSRLSFAASLIETTYRSARRRAMDRAEWVYLAIASGAELSEPAVCVRAFSFPDGRRGIDPANPSASWELMLAQQRDLRPVSAVLTLPELRLLATAIPPESGPLVRPPVHRYYRLGHPECHSVTPIPMQEIVPERAASELASRVIEISPLGACRILRDSNAYGTVTAMEIAFTYALPPADPENEPDDPGPERYAAIQISATTGYSRGYTP